MNIIFHLYVLEIIHLIDQHAATLASRWICVVIVGSGDDRAERVATDNLANSQTRPEHIIVSIPIRIGLKDVLCDPAGRVCYCTQHTPLNVLRMDLSIIRGDNKET